jgi:hypothetical protein
VTQTEEYVDVEETEDTVEPVAEATEEKKTSKRPSMPEGYATPIAFAHALTEKLRAEGKLGDGEEFRPQVVYSNIRNISKTNPIPVVYVDTEGNEYEDQNEDRTLRPAFRLDADGKMAEAMQWWDEKEARVAQRKQNAKEKAEKKASAPAKAAKKADTEEAPVVADEEYEVDEAE